MGLHEERLRVRGVMGTNEILFAEYRNMASPAFVQAAVIAQTQPRVKKQSGRRQKVG